MAAQTYTFSGATTNTTATNYAQVTQNFSATPSGAQASGNPNKTGTPLLVKSYTVNLSTSSGGAGWPLIQDTSANDGSYTNRVLGTSTTLAGAIGDSSCNFPYLSGQTVYYGFKKDNNATTVRIQRGSASGYNIYLAYNGSTASTWFSGNALNSEVVVYHAPNAPSVSASVASSSQINLSWSAPTDDGGSAVNGYAIFYQASGGAWQLWPTYVTGTSASITGLDGSTTYNFRVCAQNGVTYFNNGSNYGANSNYYMGAAGTASATTQAAYAAPVFTNGLNIGTTVRVGENWSDTMVASNTYAALGLSGTSYEGITLLPGQGINVINNTAYLVNPITAATSGTYTLRVRAYGPGGQADTTQTVSLRQALPEWTDTSLANGTKGSGYSSTFAATNATSWNISGVPAGLSTSGTSGATVTVSGTPTVYGSQTITATPYQSDGDAGTTQYINFTINDSALTWSDQSISSSARKGTAYSDSVSATGGTTRTYALHSGSLPTGVTVNSSTGAISGTPTTYGTYTFVVRATNADASSTIYTNTLTLTVQDVALSWSDQVLASSLAIEGQSYSDGVSVSAGPTTAYSIASGALPTGLSLNTSTGAITGTPTTAGSYSFVVRATNGTGETLDTSTLSITVEVAGGYVKVWNGSAWVEGTAYVYNGSSWLEGTVQISNGAGWTDSFST